METPRAKSSEGPSPTYAAADHSENHKNKKFHTLDEKSVFCENLCIATKSVIIIHRRESTGATNMPIPARPQIVNGTMLFTPLTRYTKDNQVIELDIWRVDKPRLEQNGAVPSIPGYEFSWPDLGAAHLLSLRREGRIGAVYIYHNDVVMICDGPADIKMKKMTQVCPIDWLFLGRNHVLIRHVDFERFLECTAARGEAIKVTQEELDKMRHHVPLMPKPQEPLTFNFTESMARQFLESRGYEVFTPQDWQEYLDETAKDLVTHIEREIEDARDERRRHHVSLVNRLQRRIKHEKNRVSRERAGTDTDNGESQDLAGTVGYDAFFLQTKRLASDGPNEQSIPKSASGFARPGFPKPFDNWTESSLESGAGGKDEKANGETESDKG